MIAKKFLHKKSTLFGWTAGLLLSCLMALSILMFWNRARQGTDMIVHQDIVHLQKIFGRIQKDCYIISFAHIRNYIDFLSVISFVGSQVGPMNLAFAKNWQGAYMKTNPMIQEKLYVILKNKQGYFIVPGDGVTLNNDKVIGKDIVLDYDTDMNAMIHDTDGLLSKFGALAAQIQVGSESMNQMLQFPEIFQSID